MKIKLAGIEWNSVVDGPGLRAVVFAQGCPHSCPGCHNPQAIDPDGGLWHDLNELAARLCSDRSIRGVTFSGGEPFMQAGAFAALARLLRQAGLDIVTYSGYTYEELLEKAAANKDIEALLAASDILIDGPYVREQRDISLAFRGSANQRVIDLAKTRQTGKVVLSELHFR